MLTGSLVAIATPMQPGGALDLPALRKLIDFHVANGTAGIVIVGTTGESPTVDFDEHCLLIKTAVEHAAGRIPVIAGTGANSTAEAIELTAYAKKVGADSALSVVPYYNKPTQEGLYRHFRTIAETVDLPLILYNVPGRTVADMGNDTVLRLAAGARHRRHQGRHRRSRARQRAAARAGGRGKDDFAVYSGDDITGAAADADGRPRRDLGHRQRRAQADGTDVQRRARRRYRDRAREPTIACCRCIAICSSKRIRSR